MAARKWTKEQREQQSKAIHTWEPWQHSTGAKSAVGKAIVSRNAYSGSFRKRARFGQWLLDKSQCTAVLTPEIIAGIAIRSYQFGIELSESDQHHQFFADAAIRNVIAAMAISCKNQLGFYYRACLINTAAETVLGKR